LYVQMIGRGTRTFPGKADCLTLDVVGATTRHSLQTSYSLFGIAKGGESAREAKVRREIEREAAALAEEARGKLIAERVDLFKQTELHWATAPDGKLFVLSLGAPGAVHVVQQPDETWSVLLVQASGRLDVAQEKLTFDYALGVAKDVAKAASASANLVNPSALWRTLPPTESQLLYCKRNGLPKPSTRGGASDAIAVHKAKARMSGPPPSARQQFFLRHRGLRVPATAAEAGAVIGRLKAGAR
jgi:hypothetical protein